MAEQRRLIARSELQRAWMADHDGTRLLRGQRAQLAEGCLRLLNEDIDDVGGALLAQRAEAPEESLARNAASAPSAIARATSMPVRTPLS